MGESKTLHEITQVLRKQLPKLNSQYQIESLGVFGSYVQQRDTKSNDLDLLVTFRKAPGLLKFIELENYLSDMLGIKVDLVMKEALKPRIGDRVLREVIPV